MKNDKNTYKTKLVSIINLFILNWNRLPFIKGRQFICGANILYTRMVVFNECIGAIWYCEYTDIYVIILRIFKAIFPYVSMIFKTFLWFHYQSYYHLCDLITICMVVKLFVWLHYHFNNIITIRTSLLLVWVYCYLYGFITIIKSLLLFVTLYYLSDFTINCMYTRVPIVFMITFSYICIILLVFLCYIFYIHSFMTFTYIFSSLNNVILSRVYTPLFYEATFD